MNMDFTVSEDTQVVLLLCGALGRTDRDLAPLTTPQYNAFALALNGIGKRPADIVEDGLPNEALIGTCCSTMADGGRIKPLEKERVIALLRRGVTLSTALDKWASYGVRVVGRADAHYPERLRKHLGGKASPVLYFAGNVDLLSGGGMAFVGSRDINEDASEMIRSVVRDCVASRMNVVSGGARGADQTAMQEAFANGGTVIGAVPCDLLKACLDPANREALASGSALLLSAFDPEIRPFSYGAIAMDRNKYIYGMADACFVAQSGVGPKSGTWAGAVEELKRENHHPVFVYLPENASDGCVGLVKKGAMAWQVGRSAEVNLAMAGRATAKSEYEGDLFGNSFAVVAERGIGDEMPLAVAEPIAARADAEVTPYGLVRDWVVDFLQTPREEKDVRRRLANGFDLVTPQIKQWLDELEEEGVLVRKEYPKGKKGKIVMFERGASSTPTVEGEWDMRSIDHSAER